MGSLLEKFAGKIDLIYIDPPFATGADFSFTAPVGESGEDATKEASAIEEKAYRDTWGSGIQSYLSMIYSRMQLMHDLLAQDGSIYVHLGTSVSHVVRMLLDELFGLERIIRASSDPGDLIADFFCGSGTTLGVAEKLGRRWIGCDLSRYAIHTTRKRQLGITGCKPFEILNLGKYERQYWQGVTFGENGKSVTERSLYEYLAFILKLYGVQPLPGLTHLHGKQGKAMIHIGAVDAPVTIDEINAAVAECVQLKQTELHVLGWEWEMGLYDLMVAEAKQQGVKLLLLQIPREVMEQQAVDKGDIQFFELAYLEVKIETPKKHTVTVTLADFVIPNTELIPEEVRTKVKKWSDYIDYWAADWHFQNDTFMQGWVTYRTRKDRKLALTADPHTYDKAGRYRILVKVVDIFGNDTSQVYDVEV